jgi:hypothetical protein
MRRITDILFGCWLIPLFASIFAEGINRQWPWQIWALGVAPVGALAIYQLIVVINSFKEENK